MGPSAQTAQISVAPSVTRFFPQYMQVCSYCPSLRRVLRNAGVFLVSVLLGHCLLHWHLLGRLLPAALKFVNSPSAQTAQISVAPPVTRFFPQKLQACSHCPSLRRIEGRELCWHLFGALASFGAKICELAFGSDSTNFGRAFGHSLFPKKLQACSHCPSL